MVLARCARIGLSAVILISAARAQGSPRFDVVSIREVPRDAPPINREQDFTPVRPGGQYIDSRTPPGWMIAFAYDVRFPERDLAGLPGWTKDRAYAVAAKPAEGFPSLPPAENREQVRIMMRSMLADRFHLQIHKETREGRICRLEIAKGGIKLAEVDPPVPPAREGHVDAAMRNDGGIRMIARKATMAGLATTLNLLTDRVVVDETGLKGYYDFDVAWSGPETGDGRAPEVRFGGPELVGLLISNLQSSFGLRLISTTGPVEVWVVDRIEPPTEN